MLSFWERVLATIYFYIFDLISSFSVLRFILLNTLKVIKYILKIKGLETGLARSPFSQAFLLFFHTPFLSRWFVWAFLEPHNHRSRNWYIHHIDISLCISCQPHNKHNIFYYISFFCMYTVSVNRDFQCLPSVVSSSSPRACSCIQYTYHNKFHKCINRLLPHNMDSLFNICYQHTSKYAWFYIFKARIWRFRHWCSIRAYVIDGKSHYQNISHRMIAWSLPISRLHFMAWTFPNQTQTQDFFLCPPHWLIFRKDQTFYHFTRSYNYFMMIGYYFKLSRNDYLLAWPSGAWTYLRKEKFDKLEPIDYNDITLSLLFFAFDSYYICMFIFILRTL